MKEEKKIKIDFKNKGNRAIIYNGVPIEIENNIGIRRSGVLIDKAFNQLELTENEIIDGGLLLEIYAYFDLLTLEMCTNIDMKDVDYDVLVSSGLLYEITNNIMDYKTYKDILGIAIINYNNNIIQNILTKGVGEVFMKLIPSPDSMEEYTQSLMGDLREIDKDGSLSELSELLAKNDVLKKGKEILQEDKEIKNKKGKMN